MRRTFLSSVVLGGLAVSCLLCWSGSLSADVLQADSMDQPAPAVDQQIPEVIDAIAKLGQRNEQGALADLKKAKEKYPQLSPAEVNLAKFYAQANQGERTIFWLEQATQESPNDPEAYAILGQEALRTNRRAEARLLFEKAHELLKTYAENPDRKKQLQATAAGQLAMLSMSRKDWTVAKAYLAELLDIQQNDPRALQLLGQVLFEEGKTAEALEKLKAAKTANENVLTPEATLAIWFQNAGDREKAQEYMVAALKAAPQDYNTRLQAAQWALRIESLDTARKQSEDALKLAEAQKLDPTPALLSAGTVAIFQNDYAAAENHLRRAVANQPANFSATNNLAAALCEQDDETKRKLALAYAEMNYRLYPDNLEAASTYGRALFQLEQLQAAAQVFARIQGSGRPLSKDTAYYLAALLAKSEQGKEQARTLLKEVISTEGIYSQRVAAEKLAKELGM